MEPNEFNSCVHCLQKFVLRNQALRERQGGKFQRAREKALIRKLRSNWNKQIDYLIRETKDMQIWKDNAKRQEEAQKNAVEPVAPIVAFQAIVSEMPGKDVIAGAIVGEMRTSMNKAGKAQVKKLKLGQFGIGFNASDPTPSKFLDDKLRLELSNSSGNIDATTQRGVQKVLAKGANDGLTHAEVATEIRKQADSGVFSVARSELIAQTEIGRAYGKASNIPLEDFQSKFPEREVQKKWLTVHDSNVRDTHRVNEANGWINFNQVHSGTNEQFAPSKDFNCRCVEEYRVP